jgi:hypothetical protein
MAKILDVTVGDKTYKLQKPSAAWYIDLTDRCTNRNGQLIKKMYICELLKHVVIEPKNIDIDSFGDDIAALEDIIVELEDFLRQK